MMEILQPMKTAMKNRMESDNRKTNNRKRTLKPHIID